MNIFLLGATGGTGREILIKLLHQQHQVFALVRNPETWGIKNPHLKIIKGDIYSPETYQHDLSTCDLVISALGTGTVRKPTEIYSKGGQQLITAMQTAGIRRLVTITSGAFDPTDPVTRTFIVKYIVQPLFKNIYSDMQKWETILENNKDVIDWTIVRPTRLLNGKAKDRYRIQLNHCPKGGSKIGRSDLADFVVKQISSKEFVHKKPVISY